MWAMAREYIGKDRPPTKTTVTNSPATEPALIMITASSAEIAARKVTIDMTRRRS